MISNNGQRSDPLVSRPNAAESVRRSTARVRRVRRGEMNGARQSGQSGFLPVQKLRGGVAGACDLLVSPPAFVFLSVVFVLFFALFPGSSPTAPRNRSPGNRAALRASHGYALEGSSSENALPRRRAASHPGCRERARCTRNGNHPPALGRIVCTRARPRNSPDVPTMTCGLFRKTSEGEVRFCPRRNRSNVASQTTPG